MGIRHALGLCTAAFALCLAGCNQAQKDDGVASRPAGLTPGNVKLNLVKGQTTQAQVQEAFGPPDLVTHRDDQQIWTYDKTSYDWDKRSDYWTIIFAGQGGDRVRSSSRSTMLIIYFDQRDVVTDYRLSAVKF
jgi:hypothetical protein